MDIYSTSFVSLVIMGSAFYLKTTIPHMIKSVLDKELEKYKIELAESTKKKDIFSNQIVTAYSQVLIELGELSTYSFGLRMGVLEMTDAQYIKNRYYSLAKFSHTYWPYFSCNLKRVIQDFINSIEMIGIYDPNTDSTTFDGHGLEIACENVQFVIKKELDNLYK